MATNDTNNATVAIYKSHPEAEAAIKDLQRSGFDMKKLPTELVAQIKKKETNS
ncbi:MAG: hypothetical protein ABI604_17330 [Nitrospirota bacterium]